MRKLLKMTKSFSDVIVTSNIDLTVEMNKHEIETDVYEYEFLLKWDEEQAKKSDSKVVLLWDLPCVDIQYMWHPNCRSRRVLDADWRLKIDSMLTGSAPVALLFNMDDRNTFAFATDEIKKVTSVRFGVDDGRNIIAGEIAMGLKQFVGRNTDRLLVRADFRKIPYYEVLDGVRLWWEEVLHIQPMAVPDIARRPMYSSWYNYHQDIKADELEEECIKAKALGMDTIIVDDGWQTEDNGSGYGFTGDWEVCPKKIPNMREHVKRVHDIGMKYILWYSVPFIGFYSNNWERFKNKVLYTIDRNSTGVLDPRYPEVREFLIGIYENALNEYDLDGFKLDFIDRFLMQNDDEVNSEMDYSCVQEATERLMTDIVIRLKAVKSDVMIEFRQKYIGPGMRQFGNMFRVADCPSDITNNRIGIADIRLLSGETAAHSDMITWHEMETPEDAALQILNCMFGVIQFSKNIKHMIPEHKEMVAFWLAFAKENRKLLLESEFIPYEPHYLYPVIKAYDDTEEVIGVYANNKIIYPDFMKDKSRIINATKQEKLFLSIEKDCRANILILDCSGKTIKKETITLHKGVSEVAVPRSGLLEITK